MKKETIHALIATWCVDNSAEKGKVDENALAAFLMTEKDVDFGQIRTRLNPALIACGMKDKIQQMDAEQKKIVVKACTKKALTVLNTHKDVRVFAEGIESGLTDKNTLKVVIATMKEKSFNVPKKIRLGATLEMVVEYFVNLDEKQLAASTPKKLATFIQENLLINEKPVEKEVAVRIAASNHTFAWLIASDVSLDDVN